MPKCDFNKIGSHTSAWVLAYEFNVYTLFFYIGTSKFCLRLAVLTFFSFLRLKCSYFVLIYSTYFIVLIYSIYSSYFISTIKTHFFIFFSFFFLLVFFLLTFILRVFF